MSEMPTPDEMNRALFAHLVMSLTQSALLGLGKIVNPATQKAEVNLEASQQIIDLLDMLEAKTRGNLDKEEEQFLRNTLSMLKLNFVETSNSAPASPAEPSPTSAPAPAPEAGPAKKDDEKVKFRKTYG